MEFSTYCGALVARNGSGYLLETVRAVVDAEDGLEHGRVGLLAEHDIT